MKMVCTTQLILKSVIIQRLQSQRMDFSHFNVRVTGDIVLHKQLEFPGMRTKRYDMVGRDFWGIKLSNQLRPSDVDVDDGGGGGGRSRMEKKEDDDDDVLLTVCYKLTCGERNHTENVSCKREDLTYG